MGIGTHAVGVPDLEDDVGTVQRVLGQLFTKLQCLIKLGTSGHVVFLRFLFIPTKSNFDVGI